MIHASNINNVIVMSRHDAENAYNGSNNDNNIPTAIISISDIGQNEANIKQQGNVTSIKRVWFDDAEAPSIDAITKHDAEDIANFIKTIATDGITERIVIHCGAGVSRSAGVAAATMLYLMGDDSKIFNNHHYRPNMTCYRRVLDELTRDLSDEELEQLIHK